ncbi:MAG: nucleoside triphosphate pyrophosphohydrolase [Anaerolineales bacterium]
MSTITILGLGPGAPGLLTRQAWETLNAADEIWARTRLHPVLNTLPEHLQIHSFDSLYETLPSFQDVYAHIVEEILTLGQRPQGVIYAVPGHPFVAEDTAPEIVRRAQEMGISTHLIGGMSFLDVVWGALGLDPFPRATLGDALTLGARHVPDFPPDSPAFITQIYDRHTASEVKLTLMSVYPDAHPTRLVHAAGTPEEIIEDLPLYAIDRSAHIGLMTVLYLPPLGEGTSFEAFHEVVAHLRAPDGCPWDRKQTHQSLRADFLEEAYEVLAALDAEDMPALQEELGDLLLHIFLQAQIAAEEGEFTLADVVRGIHTKIVRRHPHVFGDLALADEQAVLQNWEKLKAGERALNGETPKGVLSGVSPAMPALSLAQTYQRRAARVGFDWPNRQGVLDKLQEEVREFQQAATPTSRQAEFGDILFSLVNLARWEAVDAETALREASARFQARFAYIEAQAAAQGRSVQELSLEEMDALWNQAKQQRS